MSRIPMRVARPIIGGLAIAASLATLACNVLYAYGIAGMASYARWQASRTPLADFLSAFLYGLFAFPPICLWTYGSLAGLILGILLVTKGRLRPDLKKDHPLPEV